MASAATMGVAISTTGDEHRLDFLRASVEGWSRALPLDAPLFVTVDGDEQALATVASLLAATRACVYRVGQGGTTREGHQGVAVNKNTGLELLMDHLGPQGYPVIEHLFLSDDDTYPLGYDSLRLHLDPRLQHSMVVWGTHRLQDPTLDGVASWSWPRGVMLYTAREAVVVVGGMDENFGPGGHEHVEWSRRIHQAHLTPVLFGSPGAYGEQRGMAARLFWHCEDIRQTGENQGDHQRRRQQITSVRRIRGDWSKIDALMLATDRVSRFVSFRASENHRGSATMLSTH